jgi:hypothetical protein
MDKLPHYCPICAFLEWNLDGLVEMCWDYLDMVRSLQTRSHGACMDWAHIVDMAWAVYTSAGTTWTWWVITSDQTGTGTQACTEGMEVTEPWSCVEMCWDYLDMVGERGPDQII